MAEAEWSVWGGTSIGTPGAPRSWEERTLPLDLQKASPCDNVILNL